MKPNGQPLRTPVAVAAVALVGACGWMLHELVRPAPPAASPSQAADAPAARPAPPPPAVNVRAQIRRIVERDAPSIVTERDLTRYLDDLEVQARRNGRVTALDVEPGVMAIRRLRPQLGEERALELTGAFTSKMMEMSARFDGRDRPAPPPDFDALAQQIERTPPAERGPLNLRLHEALATLDPEARLRVLDRIAPRIGN